MFSHAGPLGQRFPARPAPRLFHAAAERRGGGCLEVGRAERVGRRRHPRDRQPPNRHALHPRRGQLDQVRQLAGGHQRAQRQRRQQRRVSARESSSVQALAEPPCSGGADGSRRGGPPRSRRCGCTSPSRSSRSAPRGRTCCRAAPRRRSASRPARASNPRRAGRSACRPPRAGVRAARGRGGLGPRAVRTPASAEAAPATGVPTATCVIAIASISGVVRPRTAALVWRGVPERMDERSPLAKAHHVARARRAATGRPRALPRTRDRRARPDRPRR